jgi:hypothetical protein
VSATTFDGVALTFGYDGELPMNTSLTWPGSPQIKTLYFDYDSAFNLEVRIHQ